MILVLFGAFASGTLIYAGLILSGILDERVPPEPHPFIVPALLLLALLDLILGFIWGELWPSASAADDRPSPQQFLRKYQVRLIIQLALFESVAIYGLVAYMLGLDRLIAIGFCGISLLAIFLKLPSLRSALEEYRLMSRKGHDIGETKRDPQHRSKHHYRK